MYKWTESAFNELELIFFRTANSYKRIVSENLGLTLNPHLLLMSHTLDPLLRLEI